MRSHNDLVVEGERDPKPYKVDRVTQNGAFVSRVAQYATEAEAMAITGGLTGTTIYIVDAHSSGLQRNEPSVPSGTKSDKPICVK
jgi:hypothetical protein